MKEEIKQGDVVIYKKWFFTKTGIVNLVGENYLLVDDFSWFGLDKKVEHCDKVLKEKVTKL